MFFHITCGRMSVSNKKEILCMNILIIFSDRRSKKHVREVHKRRPIIGWVGLPKLYNIYRIKLNVYKRSKADIST